MCAIPFDVVSKKPDRPSAPKVPATYGKMLIERAAALGLPRPQFAKLAGISDLTAWRVETGHKDSSVKAANAMRSVLLERGLKDIPPVPVGGGDEWSQATAPPKPTAIDSAEEIIRKNLIRAREQAGFDQLGAADASGIAFDLMRAYELGEKPVPNSDLRTIAPVYGRKPGDFFEVDMPGVDLDGAKRVFFRGRPDDIQLLTPEELARAAALEREYDEKIRERKRAQLDHFKKAKERKGKR